MTIGRAVNIIHHYGHTKALDGINLDIEAGQLLGMLGPNGAGKSTLINLFTGLRRPGCGTVELFGGDPRDPRFRREIGITPQDTALPATLRVGEVVDYVAAHFPDPLDRSELLTRFGLNDLLRRQTGGLSGGQRRRLSVSLAFVGNPRLVFLDEPTTGLDVEGRHALWDGIRQFHAAGGTVVLTSHYLEEVEALAERVVVIGAGRILADDTVEAIRDRVAARKVSYLGTVPVDLPGVLETRTNNDRTELLTTDADQLVRDLVGAGVPFSDLAISQASLEDAFLTLTSA